MVGGVAEFPSNADFAAETRRFRVEDLLGFRVWALGFRVEVEGLGLGAGHAVPHNSLGFIFTLPKASELKVTHPAPKTPTSRGETSRGDIIESA